MDESSAERECPEKKSKRKQNMRTYWKRYVILLNVIMIATQNAIKILQPFQFLKVPSHQHQQ